MLLKHVLHLLQSCPESRLHVMLPDRSFVPAHFHVTEVALVRKDFIDCGGTRRSTASCTLQIWVADDVDHRLNAAKLLKILALAQPVLETDELSVELEYETSVTAVYPLASIEQTPSGLLFSLALKHTACLAPELCLPQLP
ncbi:MAG: DUF6428 family protein [Planctomycetaceae bacterium]